MKKRHTDEQIIRIPREAESREDGGKRSEQAAHHRIANVLPPT
ncbi:hypothetical protein [Burkholderia sp. RF4-BP95]|nr:hypothetical protein [Burkholderia sp. RF4-BP95]